MDRILALIAIPAAVLLLGGAIQVGRPLPPVEVAVNSAPLTLPGKFKVDFPKQGQMAVGEAGVGLVTATPNQEPVAIASLTKMMTAYLLLQAKPLKPGEDGPVTTITAADVAVYDADRKAGDSVMKVAAGEKLTEHQLLEALLLPSADNIATLIGEQVAGNEDAFVKKMNEAAKQLGMNQTTYADAAGVNAATVSTASDQLRIAQAAMQDRTFREIVRMPQSSFPVGGTVYNVNFMVGKQGITGVKTGSTLAAGSCFVGSYPITVAGKQHVLLGAVLGQVSLKEALTYDAKMLHDISPQFKTYTVEAPAEGFAHLSTPWSEAARLEPTKTLSVFGYPGMPITLAAKLTQPALPIKIGQSVATLSLSAGLDTQTVALQAGQAMPEPGILWRLHR